MNKYGIKKIHLNDKKSFQKPKKIITGLLILVFTLSICIGAPFLTKAATAQVVAPTANFAIGSTLYKYSRVILLSTTPNSIYYYTTDGSIPTTDSIRYNNYILITSDMAVDNAITIKAIATKANMTDSTVTTLNYTLEPNLEALTPDNIDIVISEMTLAEKTQLLGGGGTNRLAGAAGTTQTILKYNIFGSALSDGPAGIRITARPSGFTDSDGNQTTRYATWFPNGSARAATWNEELQQQSIAAVGKEFYYFGGDLWLAPGMNIHRHVLNGRNFEYYSEDPLLSGKTGAAEVRGFQSQRVGATIKHFASNNQETGRSNLPTQVGKRALREIYLKSFELAVKEGQPWSIMSSYNQLNGVSTAENPELLTSVLRDDWGFGGIVMTDWGGAGNKSYWSNSPSAYASLVKAGNELAMSSGSASSIQTAYNNGFLTMDEINREVKRVLQYLVKTPVFNGAPVSRNPNPYTTDNQVIAFNENVEGMLLMKNNYVNGKPSLPITGSTVALIGDSNANWVLGGTGSGSVNIDTSQNVYLQAALISYGKTVATNTSMTATQADLAALLDNGASCLVMSIRRTSGEGSDLANSAGNYQLSANESNLITNASAACHAAGKPFIVVLNMGTAVEMESWKSKADAILLVWEPGTVVAKPAAAVLVGVANPSGKMPTSWPVNVTGTANNGYNNTPAQDNFGSSSGATYTEGIFVGYRYYDTFNVPVSCEFGFGLNYSDFDFSNLQLSSNTFESLSDTLNISVDVKNISKTGGKEVVQIYVGAPGKSMQKPVKELRRYAKTKELVADETQTMSFNLDAMSFASFDDRRSAWVVEPGTYVVYAGASSKDIRQVTTFTVPQELVVETVSNVLAPTVTITEKVSPLFNAISPSCTGFVRVRVKTSERIEPVLPSSVQAIYSDGTIPFVNVTWDSINAASYARPNVFTVNGTVNGTNIKAVADITVIATDKTALASKISEAQALMETTYTLASWAALQTVLNAAILINEDENAIQTEVDAALGNLEVAIDGLIVEKPPVLAALAAYTIDEGKLLSFTLNAGDPNGDTLTYSGANLPVGATLDPASGKFNWKPEHSQAGSYNIQFTVSNARQLTDTKAATIVVNHSDQAPVMDVIPDHRVNAATLLTFNISASDPDGDNLTYSAITLPNGAIFDSSSLAFSWTPNIVGTYTVTFKVSDGRLSDSRTAKIVVNAASGDQAPVMNAIPTYTVKAGKLVSFTVKASDPDGDGDALSYSADNLPSGASFNSSTKKFSWTPTAAGTYCVTFTVSDTHLTDSKTATIVVQ